MGEGCTTCANHPPTSQAAVTACAIHTCWINTSLRLSFFRGRRHGGERQACDISDLRRKYAGTRLRLRRRPIFFFLLIGTPNTIEEKTVRLSAVRSQALRRECLLAVAPFLSSAKFYFKPPAACTDEWRSLRRDRWRIDVLLWMVRVPMEDTSLGPNGVLPVV